MHDATILVRLDLIERRLLELESRERGEVVASPATPSNDGPASGAAIARSTPAPFGAEPATASGTERDGRTPPIAPPRPPSAPSSVTEGPMASTEGVAHAEDDPTSPRSLLADADALLAQAPRPVAAEPRSDVALDAELERFLGLKVAAWAGGVIVIAAIAIFGKFVVDQGWIGGLPPSMKLLLAYALSGVFVGAGLLLRGTLGRVPSAALLAAGIGGFYASTCAGMLPLNVFGLNGGLAVGFGVTLAGAALTLRSRELSVGAISLAGAYTVATFGHLGLDRAALPEFAGIAYAAYFSAVYASALALARIGPPDFIRLRWFGALHAVIALVVFPTVSLDPVARVGFVVLWWAMTVGEASLAALSGAGGRANAVITTVATALAASLALLGTFRADPWADVQSWAPAVMCAFAVAGGMVLRTAAPCGGIDTRDREEDPEAVRFVVDVGSQSTVLLAVAGALLLAQIGVVIRGGALGVVWTALGAIGILVGRRLRTLLYAQLGMAGALLGTAAATVHFLLGSLLAATASILWQWPAASGRSMWAVRIDSSLWSPVVVSFLLVAAARLWTGDRRPDARPTIGAGLFGGCAALLWTAITLHSFDGYAAIVGLLAIPAVTLAVGRTRALVQAIGVTSSSLAAIGWCLLTLAFATQAPDAAGAAASSSGGLLVAGLVVAGFALLAGRFRGERFGANCEVLAFIFGLTAIVTLAIVEIVRPGADAADARRIEFVTGMLVAGIGATTAVLARQSGRAVLAQCGIGAVAIATLGILFSSAIGTVRPTLAGSADGWIGHWLLSMPNLAFPIVIAAFLALPDDELAPRGQRRAVVLFVAGVWSTIVVARFFDPAASPPFGSSETLRQAALSVWIGALGVVAVALGLRLDRDRLRWSGLALLGLVAGKVLVFDMAGAPALWRVAGLLLTGFVLVATSVLYSRAARPAKPGIEARD